MGPDAPIEKFLEVGWLYQRVYAFFISIDTNKLLTIGVVLNYAPANNVCNSLCSILWVQRYLILAHLVGEKKL